jgi:hypothetical protein
VRAWHEREHPVGGASDAGDQASALNSHRQGERKAPVAPSFPCISARNNRQNQS